jgi:hypothetical protein
MIAVDTNILVYAHRRDVPENPRAFGALKGLLDAGTAWGMPWPCVHEFIGVVTHPRVTPAPTTIAAALQQVEAWLLAPGCTLLGEAPDHLTRLSQLLRASGAVGPRVHDARVAAICLGAGVDVLWSVDRDFSRFPGLRVVNPLAV